MRGDVGRYQEVLELDLSGQDVNILEQILSFSLEAALQVCCFRPFALVAALQLLQLALLLLNFLLCGAGSVIKRYASHHIASQTTSKPGRPTVDCS